MTLLGGLGFTAPWVLAALAGLPVLWYLLRISPPQPRRVPFPPLRILRALVQHDETPARTPLWLLLLRLLIATLIIVALSGPVLNPETGLTGSGPVIVVIDDGWASAPDWETHVRTAEWLIDRAQRSERPVVLLGTAPAARPPEKISLHRPDAARRLLRTFQPHPWGTDRAALAARIAAARLPANADVFWLSDGIADRGERRLGETLRDLGSVHVMGAAPGRSALGLTLPQGDQRTLTARIVRATAGAPQAVEVLAATRKGLVLGRAIGRFGAQDRQAIATFDLPPEARNQVARLSLAQSGSAGGVVLLDENSAWRIVGLASGGDLEQDQPLLSQEFYLTRALSPFADVIKDDLPTLLQRRLSILMLADVGRLPEPDTGKVAAWVNAGGVLVRFAGPHLAQAQSSGGADPLLPVPLRRGDRALGGTLSWEKPAHLAPFDETSPFFGLKVPTDVVVKRQILAEPGPELGERTWARLADGTPLVTGTRQGQGWVVLFHVTASLDWSNLPLSGLFVDMLRRLVDLGEGVGAQTGEAAARTLMPRTTLDGFGRLGTAPPEALPLTEAALATTPAGPLHPPGFYAVPGSDGGRALNLLPPDARLAAIGTLPPGLERVDFAAPRQVALARWLLAAAIVLGLVDGLIVLGLRGQLPRLRPARSWRGGDTVSLLLIGFAALALAAIPRPASAQAASPGQADAPLGVPAVGAPAANDQAQPDIDPKAIAAALDTRLAYVATGDARVDSMSRAGLVGLSRVLAERTAFEPAEPSAVDPETDELVFYPVIYWPMTTIEKPLSDAALAKISAYMRHGGMILFDTRDQKGGFGSPDVAGEGTQVLRNLLSRLDIPPLVPVPDNHVLTKSFYLLQTFPGRYASGRVWVEAPASADSMFGGEASDRDGVSSVIIGGNDWAAAWAVDDNGQPIAETVPDDARQREMAYRFGVNLVMYALTGNYKADQVHVPALLERLGQ